MSEEMGKEVLGEPGGSEPSALSARYTVRSDSRVRPGMTLEERVNERKRLHAEAVARIKRAGLTLVCEQGQHDSCRGEEPDACGCLCECHDSAAAFGRGDAA